MSERDHLEEALSILGAHCGPPHYNQAAKIEAERQRADRKARRKIRG